MSAVLDILTDWALGVAVAVALLAGASALALWSWGRFARRARGLPAWSIPAGQGGPLDALVPDGADAAALINDPAEAYGLRHASIGLAARSVDVMTYIWSKDRSGRALAAELIAAAGRGVRVRVLVDDLGMGGRDPPWLDLDGTEGIEVRVFNPVRSRDQALRRGIEMLLLALRYNRRMHGKLWIADGRLALVGGRNLGDIYFGLGRGRRRNVIDLDLLLTGPIVAQAAEEFDAFWNSDLALPIAALWRGRLPRLGPGRAAPPSARRMNALPPPAGCFERALARCRRGGRFRLLADPPDKALGSRHSRAWLPDHLDPVLAGARSDLCLVSPYFVPGGSGLALLTRLAAAGVRLRIVTNALAVVDHAAVHGAYRWYRHRLLAAGAEVREVCAPTGQPMQMLHAKAALIDGTTGFVGSFNFDQRSAWLNTELGVLFDAPDLVADLAAWIAAASGPEQAYRLSLGGRFTLWRRSAEVPRRFEPQTRLLRRSLAFAIGHLPIHRLL